MKDNFDSYLDDCPFVLLYICWILFLNKHKKKFEEKYFHNKREDNLIMGHAN
jgi:hypothetical protein